VPARARGADPALRASDDRSTRISARAARRFRLHLDGSENDQTDGYALRVFLDAHARESGYRATYLTVDGYENGGEFDMEMTSARAEARWRPRQIIVVGAVGGMLSGMMMGATEMCSTGGLRPRTRSGIR
jgi:hypothetical protein